MIIFTKCFDGLNYSCFCKLTVNIILFYLAIEMGLFDYSDSKCEGGYEPCNMELSDPLVRQRFVRKVFTIVTIMVS